jgi:hypothetical protein
VHSPKGENCRTSISVEHNGVVTRVGAGISLAMSRHLSRKAERLVGTIVEVAAEGTTNSGALRHARFIRTRPDKSTLAI